MRADRKTARKVISTDLPPVALYVFCARRTFHRTTVISKYFYNELIPSLKKRGKTVIAVSHDDRYYHCADRIVTLEDGKVRSIEQPKDLAKDLPQDLPQDLAKEHVTHIVS